MIPHVITPDLYPYAHVPAPKMTFEEFLEWADEDTFAEWVDGEVYFMSPATSWHQQIVGFLGAIMLHWVEAHQAGMVRIAPYLIKFKGGSGREPDVVFVANEHRDRDKVTYLDGPADIAVEIVSPSSRANDRGKAEVYAQGGVREYWMLDPERSDFRFLALGDDGQYTAMPVGDDGVFRSRVLDGFWLRVEWLSAEQPPALLDVLREWGIV
jgi:Uma2 family endonuclease